MTHYIFLAFCASSRSRGSVYVFHESQTQSFDAKEHAPCLPEHGIQCLLNLYQNTVVLSNLQLTTECDHLDQQICSPALVPIRATVFTRMDLSHANLPALNTSKQPQREELYRVLYETEAILLDRAWVLALRAVCSLTFKDLVWTTLVAIAHKRTSREF